LRVGRDDELLVTSNEVYGKSKVQEIVINGLQKHPEVYLTDFNLYVLEGYQDKENAEILGVCESSSKSQLLKARKYLQKLISNELEPR